MSGLVGTPTVESTIAYVESLDYDTLNTLCSRMQKILQAKRLENILATRTEHPLVACGISIPLDILSRIYDYLPPETIYETRLVCKAMYCMVKDKTTWKVLPDCIYWRKNLLGPPKSAQKIISVLKRYPCLEEVFFTPSGKVPMDEIVELLNVIPNVSRLDLGCTFSADQDVVDYLVTNLPLKKLQIFRSVPSELSGLVCLEILDTRPDVIDPRIRSIESRTLKTLKISITDIATNRLLSNCPNLETLQMVDATVHCPLAHSKLRRLHVREINHHLAIRDLECLEHFHFDTISRRGVSNNSMHTIHEFHITELGVHKRRLEDNGYEQLYTRALDWDNCPRVSVQYRGRLRDENTDTPLDSPLIQELSSVDFEWMSGSNLPQLKILTLDWVHLGTDSILKGLKELMKTSWIARIQHFNFRRKYDSPHYIERAFGSQFDQLFNSLFDMMPELQTVRLVGMTLSFSNTSKHTTLRELTIEGITPAITRGLANYTCLNLKNVFLSLKILRLPLWFVQKLKPITIHHLLKPADGLQVQVPLYERYETDGLYQEWIREGKVSYYPHLRNPWYFGRIMD